MEHFVTIKKISHDEAMVVYLEQATSNKPVRFGYKVWYQNAPSGYLTAFVVYQGKTFKSNEELESIFGE